MSAMIWCHCRRRRGKIFSYAICASLTCIHRKVTTPRPLSRGRTEQSGGKYTNLTYSHLHSKEVLQNLKYEKWKEPDLCSGQKKHVHGLTIY
eukprot:scaffold14400_cov132-Skeletonema_marinoi.AAC.3